MRVNYLEIQDSMKEAMRRGDKLKVSTLRMLISDVKNLAIAKRVDASDLSEEELVEVLSRHVKRRNEAASEFRKAGLDDLADKEGAEAEILKVYLPEQVSEDDVRRIVKEAIASLDASGAGDMGKVMSEVMPKLKGRADGKMVNQVVKQELAHS